MSKSKTKGFGFERDVAYSLLQGGYQVKRTGNDNEAGIDVMAVDSMNRYLIECKRHKGFSWNQLVKYFKKTRNFANEVKLRGNNSPVLVFKANQQPALVMYEKVEVENQFAVVTFEYFFSCEFQNRPKGFKFIREE